MCTTVHPWNAKLYDDRHAFVHQMAAGLVELLAPQLGERILDLGCGTGALTQQVANSGAVVIGVDLSSAMIAQARQSFPELQFEIADATVMEFDESFDAIFSNAALHWVKQPEAAIARMFQALKPGGRLVIEMGGKGNVRQILDALLATGHLFEVDLTPAVAINYFPSIAEYSTLLEQQGFEVQSAALFDRPTPLSAGDRGLRNWVEMFRPGVASLLPANELDRFFESLNRRSRESLYRDNAWQADYRRLRLTARRP